MNRHRIDDSVDPRLSGRNRVFNRSQRVLRRGVGKGSKTLGVSLSKGR